MVCWNSYAVAMAQVTPGGEEEEEGEREGNGGRRRRRKRGGFIGHQNRTRRLQANEARPKRIACRRPGEEEEEEEEEEERSLIEDLKRQVDSLSRCSKQASTQGWKRSPHPSNAAPPRSEVYPYSPGLC